MVMQSTMIVGPDRDRNGKAIPTAERLRAIKLTNEEIDRVCHVFAYGPVTQKPIDKGLIEAGILEMDDPESDTAVNVTGRGWGKASNFYAPDGSVRDWIRADSKLPQTDRDKYMCALSDKNNTKIAMHQMQNALIAFLRGDPNARDLAGNCMEVWTGC